MPPTIIRREVAYKGWLQVSRVELEDEEGPFHREVEHHGNGAAVLPYDPERRVALLVQLPRTPVVLSGATDHLIEAPAGLIDEGEEPEACARREALEEAGVRLDVLEPLGFIWTMPGVSTERMGMFLAPYRAADRVAAGGGVEGEREHITVMELPLAELARRADANMLTDIRVLMMVQSLRLRHPELF